VLRGQVEPLLDQFNPVYRGSAYYSSALAPQVHQATKSDQFGLYAQDQISAGGLRITIAGRQDWAYDKLTNFTNPAAITVQKTKSDAFTWQAGAVYLFDNGLAPYASYAESFVPQGGDASTNVTGRTFVPTAGQQYEGGIRYEPKGGKAYFTLGAYQIKQQNVLTPTANGTCLAVTGCQEQTGEIRIRGVEFEARAQTAVGLTLVGSLTRNWSKITRTNTAAQLGKEVAQVPHWLASAFIDYRFPETMLPGLGVGGGVRYTGAIFGENTNNVLYRSPDYALFDLFVRYDVSGGRREGFALSVNARNLANKTYVALCSGPQSCYYGSGRTVTARLQYRW
jgi:iron complex outermembrane receptor protein